MMQKKPEFISLIDALSIIAERVNTTPFPLDHIPPSSPAYSFWSAKLSEIDEDFRFSKAAELLNAALRTSDNTPIWHEFSEQERCPIPNKLREQEGRQILIRAINVAAVRQQDRCRHLSECFQNGVDPLEKPVLYSDARQVWQPGVPVGFDRSELIKLLEEAGVEHPFEVPTKPRTKQAPPVNSTENRGGRKAGPFREAVEHLYLKHRSTGKTEMLSPGKTDGFIEEFKKSLAQGEDHNPFIAERIASITRHRQSKLDKVGYKITTNEMQRQSKKKKTIELIPAVTKDKGDVSDILHDLRKKYPLT